MTTATIQAVFDGGRLTYVTIFPPSRHVMTPLSRASYLAAIAGFHTWVFKSVVGYLAQCADNWATAHGGVYPKPGEMTPNGAVGRVAERSFKRQSAQHSWPWVFQSAWPFNNFHPRALMQPGTDPGSYTYTASGSHFELVGHLPGGQSYILRIVDDGGVFAESGS